MGIGEGVGEAREGIGEGVASLEARFEGTIGRFEPGCDADRIAREARTLRAEAHEAEEVIAGLVEFLKERLADARRVEEKAGRLADDADSRYYGPVQAEV